MSNKTIAKFCGVVIGLTMAVSCSHLSSRDRYAVNASEFSQDYDKPIVVGTLESAEITESSGLAASLCQTDVLWTHNDSGDDAFLFALSSKGKHLGTWQVTSAENDDWEDLAAYKDASGNCYLYIGDIGNNKRERAEHRVYRVKEPAISAETSTSGKKTPLQTEPADSVAFKFSGSVHDAETMMVHQPSGQIYVLTKRVDGPSHVFKVAPEFGSKVEAQKVGEVMLPAVPNGLLTGGSISPDGKRVIVVDYSTGYELSLEGAATFDEIWKQKPVAVDVGERKQGEAVTYSADGKSIYVTSERRNSAINQIRRR